MEPLIPLRCNTPAIADLPDEIQVWHLDYSNYPGGHRRKVWEAKTNHWQADHTDEMIRRLHACRRQYGGW